MLRNLPRAASSKGGKMKHGHFNENWRDENGIPKGGVSCGRGFTISWQNGALGRGDDRSEPNGAFVEDVIQAVVRRLEEYQSTKFRCLENAAALAFLRDAALCLDNRTTRRETEGVEGTHKV
jgi:hypothetical protein